MEYLPTVLLGALSGLLARLFMLRRDYRQYPSYPQGWAIHLFIGFIASLIGAILVPAFLEKEFAAVSFLLLAASQFREVRTIERNTLESMEQTEMVPRGLTYIEGIARVFEARNYLAIWTALLVAIIAELLQDTLVLQLGGAAAAAVLSAAGLNRFMEGGYVSDIADVEAADIAFSGPLLQVEDVDLMNIGLKETRETYLKNALAAVVRPRNPDAKATLANLGQMQAIAHDVTAMMGVRMDVGEQEYTPVVRRHRDKGYLVLVLLPMHHDAEAFLTAIKRVPLLEGAVRRPLRSTAGKMVD